MSIIYAIIAADSARMSTHYWVPGNQAGFVVTTSSAEVADDLLARMVLYTYLDAAAESAACAARTYNSTGNPLCCDILKQLVPRQRVHDPKPSLIGTAHTLQHRIAYGPEWHTAAFAAVWYADAVFGERRADDPTDTDFRLVLQDPRAECRVGWLGPSGGLSPFYTLTAVPQAVARGGWVFRGMEMSSIG